jgi:uncharacterized protein YbjT (DUF2867 family)
MRVFVTGATGHLGSAVVPELLQAGHEVVGLARSEASAAALTAVGAAVHRGDLDDLDGLREAASAADGVIHLAFKHDAMRAGDHAAAVAAGPRVDAENTIIGLADRGVRSSVVRLPPVVHSTRDKHGFIPTLIAAPEPQAGRATSAMAPTAGPPATPWTPAASTAWPLRRPRRDHGCTPWATRAFRSGRTPR